MGLEHVNPVFKLPNLTAHYRRGGKWGYVQIAGVAKRLGWEDSSDSSMYDLSGSAFDGDGVSAQ